jgi:hypothetical protein
MLTDKEILKIAENYVLETEKEIGIPLIIVPENVIKKPYGNVYSYTSKEAYLTKSGKHDLLGNAPFLVEKKSEKIIEFGTYAPEEYFLEEYEAGRWNLPN